MRSRILVGLIAGTIGGFLGWLLQESLIHYNAHIVMGVLPGQGASATPLTAEEARTLAYCVGGMIGLFLATVDGIVEGNARKLAFGMGVGAVAGVCLGYIGLKFGGMAYDMLGGTDQVSRDPGLFSFVRQVIARSLGWALMGLGFGAGSAIGTRSMKRIWQGAFGGFLGGLIGGFVFDILPSGTAPLQELAGATGPRDVGGPSRMIGFTLIGGLSGLFIGIVEALMKQAWVKVLAGKNEGKDYILSRAMNILGRDERCAVPLFGDASVGVQHAAIRVEGNRHFLVDAGTPAGTVVNGQRVSPSAETLLRDGDILQIGSHQILFREKATASRVVRPATDMSRSAPQSGPVAVPAHHCPFCGAPKDANGNCNCNVVGASMPPIADVSSLYSPAPMPGFPDGSNYNGAFPTAGPAGPVAGNGAAMQLIGLEGPYAGQVFPLVSANILIGRESDKDIVLSLDTTISRSHASLVHESGGIVVYDNGSSNGTFVNGMRVSGPVMLAPGDAVQFGSSKFRLG